MKLRRLTGRMAHLEDAERAIRKRVAWVDDEIDALRAAMTDPDTPEEDRETYREAIETMAQDRARAAQGR